MGHHKELIRLHEYAEPGHCPAPHQLVAPMVAVRIAEFFGGQVELTFSTRAVPPDRGGPSGQRLSDPGGDLPGPRRRKR
jgi:hypothetical protein